MKVSGLEEALRLQLRAAKLPKPEREYRFCKRRWRLDFAWIKEKVAVEIHGATYNGGRHVRGRGFAQDREKINTAQLLGWRVLEFDGNAVRSGQALEVIEQALKIYSQNGESGQGNAYG